MKKLLLIIPLLFGCGLFETNYDCKMYWYQHLDSTYVSYMGKMTVYDADSEQDAEDQCEERWPDMEYCTCSPE